MPLHILAEPLNPRGKMVLVEIHASNGYEVLTISLRPDPSFMIIPCAVMESIPNSILGIKAQTHKLSNGGFVAQTTKSS